MAQPNPLELKKKEEFKISLEKMLADGRLSEKKQCEMIRSALRKTWMRSPIRKLKIELARIPDMDPNTRTKWLCECEICNKKNRMDQVQVDHKVGEHKFTMFADTLIYAVSILDVELDDLQVLCIPCHDIKTYAERNGITFDEAKIEKEIISILDK
jgi:hypothetical protein